jgi:PAS domain S-box-containing protein
MDDPLVYADERGLVRWVNPAFSILCGHTPEELQGRTAGRMLRGPDSCPKAMERLRHAVQAHEPVLQQIVNYHKDGTAYLVEIDLRPVTGGYIALEREIPR